ncbi:hypothetical protein [Pedobacter nototheniae]|uniref:hypothetical protein n=1 Tax=Pedobacter nototheniae TaxID=2488994 RepID=UPI00103C6B88|nr:hypothetical protein [Pedobacter nototheniae]
MQNIEKAITYTQKKKTFQLKDNNSHFEEPKSELHGYLDNTEDDSSVSLNFGYISTWYLWQFTNTFMQKKEVDLTFLANTTYLAIESNNWKYALSTIYPSYDSSVQLQDSALHLGQMLYLGWYNWAIDYGKLLIKMLYGKQYRGGIYRPTYPVFIMELFCRWQSIEIDRNKMTIYPTNMALYGTVLKNWNTTDIQLLNSLINQLCDFHIQQSDEYVTMDEYGNEFGVEFADSDYFVFPVEILTWLIVRRQLNLPAYSGKHELMELKINKLPTTTTPYREDSLVFKCKNKLKADNPTVAFGLNDEPNKPSGGNNWTVFDGLDE